MLEVPNRDRQTERREATRREIVAAAWAVAREQGLAQLTLRDVAERVGMRAPSLYSHFDSKNAIYDAMFEDAWWSYEAHAAEQHASLSEHPRTAAKQVARYFFEFATADLARYQLMNQRTIPGFEPSPGAYAPAVRAYTMGREILRGLGVDRQDDVDIWVSLVGGMVDQHLANDPGGQRFSRLLDRAVDMWADHVGLPPERSSRRKSGDRT
ncbi:MAG TPA: TetR/AcrR family transcriptional regulator [Mycobacteriales bacterium]|jgi:AcrR family transcriptional regulator|nr:TetR/AcrR family transcriptional regulator [Mycobacteriales bacterium]